MTDFNLIPLLPEIFLALTAMGLLIVGAVRGNEDTKVICWASVAALAIAFVVLFGLDWDTQVVLNGMFKFDAFAGLMKVFILVGLGVALSLSVRHLHQLGIARFEYPILVICAGLGMMMMVSANNFLSLYMALELQSLSLYVLAAFHRNSAKSAEAGLKYFVLGALSSGMLLFGVSLIYGFTGSVDFATIGAFVGGEQALSLGVTVGLVFVLAGLVFKLSAVPFHMWMPDVYQGAPTSVTALFALVPKVAAMGLLMRLVYEPFGPLADQWGQVLYLVAVLSMIVGAFAAIAQDNIKRLMAYSSIGNMGYALIGVIIGTEQGAAAVLVYLLIYMAMTAGVFAIILSMRRNDRSYERISDLKGLSQSHPVLAYCMAILMFSMSGIPPLAGFFGKLVVFQAAVAQEYYVLAVLGVLSSVVAAYYYLRIVKVMFFEEAGDAFDRNLPFARKVILGGSVAFIVGFILNPSFVIVGAQTAASALFAG